jgi:hypothetical protein
MTSQEQLVTWMGVDGPRQNLAAHAEQTVRNLHSDVKPGTEKFYSLVLVEVLGSGK